MINLPQQLRALNSLTKYPPIPTYHTIDGQTLREPCLEINEPVTATEKIDGTNGRIVLIPGALKHGVWSYLLGSREEFVYAKGDLLGDPQQGVLQALRPIADGMVNQDPCKPCWDEAFVTVAYFEVYGGKINGGKEYTGSGAVGVRLFDVAALPAWEVSINRPLEAIAAWREHGGQSFLNDLDRAHFAEHYGLQLVPPVGQWGAFNVASIADAYEVLRSTVTAGQATLDGGAHGKPEGMVIRTPTRSVIAKLRFEDYERTLKVGRFASQRRRA